MKTWIRRLLTAPLVGALLFSAYGLAGILAEYAQGEASKQEAAARAVVIADEALPAADTQTAAPGTAPPETPPPETPPITVDFAALQSVNPEIAGWLYCADTPINYPVAHTDNNTYYLNHLYNKKSNRNGTLFIDSRCSSDFSCANTVIYGHHMRSGAMFACLVEYGAQEYYEAHPAMYLLTPGGNYRFDIFSGYVTEPGAMRFFNVSGSEAALNAYIDEITALSDFCANASIIPQQRIVTLSTCTYDFDEARYSLHAFITEIGE